jgi:hypothetical protein
VSALYEDEARIDEVTLAVALDSWQPTRGTRLAGERRGGRRLVLVSGRLETRTPDESAPHAEWTFPPPFGREEVIGELTTADIVTMSRHVQIGRVAAYLNVTWPIPISALAVRRGRSDRGGRGSFQPGTGVCALSVRNLCSTAHPARR